MMDSSRMYKVLHAKKKVLVKSGIALVTFYYLYVRQVTSVSPELAPVTPMMDPLLPVRAQLVTTA